ncbi:hypothetical protein D3C77_646050 [compost metagenome]
MTPAQILWVSRHRFTVTKFAFDFLDFWHRRFYTTTPLDPPLFIRRIRDNQFMQAPFHDVFVGSTCIRPVGKMSILIDTARDTCILPTIPMHHVHQRTSWYR